MQSPLPMPTLLALLALALPAAPAAQAPAAELVQQTVEALELAFSPKGETAERIEALRAAAEVPDAKVVKLVAKALSDKQPTVQVAALESLRHLRHPDALEALHSCYRRDRKLVKDPERAVPLFRAIGEHGSPKSIEVLSDDPFSTTEEPILEARILALGNIRSNESVEALIALMNKAGNRRLQPHMEAFRLALARLTGEDQGKTLDAWQRWWNGAKRDFEVKAEVPKLSQVQQLRWDRFWGRETTRARPERRGDRGGRLPG